MNKAITILRRILLSHERLLITADAHAAAVMEAFYSQTETSPDDSSSYIDESHKYFETILQDNALEDAGLTDEFSSDDLPSSCIAYHRIKGFITASDSYGWYFSSQQFEKDLLAAEANPAISCHFFHINSPGGQAWYLDRLSETIQSLKKPIITFIEKCGCSAAYYIGCQADRVYAMTANDSIGCIGTMIDYYDWDGYYERLGIKRILARATKSDLKNKTAEDLKDGKPQKYITDVLDPLNEQFLTCVRGQRSKLKDAPDDEPALRGEVFQTEKAMEVGLIDGKRTFAEAVMEAKQMAADYENKQKALNIFNS